MSLNWPAGVDHGRVRALGSDACARGIGVALQPNVAHDGAGGLRSHGLQRYVVPGRYVSTLKSQLPTKRVVVVGNDAKFGIATVPGVGNARLAEADVRRTITAAEAPGVVDLSPHGPVLAINGTDAVHKCAVPAMLLHAQCGLSLSHGGGHLRGERIRACRPLLGGIRGFL